jgi:glycosyltransferase involved in cell wall biosynthesis
MTRIGINGADLEGRGTGVKRYLSSILPYLDGTGNEYFIYSRAPLPKGTVPENKRFIERPTGHTVDKSYSLWEQLILPRILKKDSIDVYFSAGYSIPLCMRIPAIVVIHDISFSVHPEWYGFREGWRRRIITRLSAGRSKKIITVSEFSRNEIIKRYAIRDEKIVIAPNAVFKRKMKISPSEKNKLIKKYDLGNPVILYVGLLLERRYIRQLIEAFSEIKKKYKNASLVLIGNNQLRPAADIGEIARKVSIENSVLHLSYVEDNELSAFYGISDIFVYLSSYEGFGIPPLEAINSGVPVVTSRSSSLAEIYEGFAVLVDDHTSDEIGAKLSLLLDNKELQKRLLKSGKQLLDKFSWEKTAGIINQEIKELSRIK